MAITPFCYLPKALFFRRMARLAIFVFFAGFLAMGFLSATERISLLPLQMAQYQFSHLPQMISSPPAGCAGGNYTSEFQKERCEQHGADTALTLFWVAFPFLWVLAFFIISFRAFRATYAEAEKAIQTGVHRFTGRVTDPPEALSDLYGWFHCLRTITVEVQSHKQLKVYVPLEAPLPKPGDQMAIGDIGKRHKKTRYFAAPYAPHVAVVRGG